MNPAHDPFADAQSQSAAQEALSVPEANQRRWSGKKTAVVAALAVGLSSTVAVGAANALPLGSQTGGGESRGGPGGGFPGFENRRGNWQQPGASTEQNAPNGTSSGSSGSTSQEGNQPGQAPQGQQGQQGQAPQGGPNFQGEVPAKPGSNAMPSAG